MFLLSSVSIWKMNLKIWKSDDDNIGGAAERKWKKIITLVVTDVVDTSYFTVHKSIAGKTTFHGLMVAVPRKLLFRTN